MNLPFKIRVVLLIGNTALIRRTLQEEGEVDARPGEVETSPRASGNRPGGRFRQTNLRVPGCADRIKREGHRLQCSLVGFPGGGWSGLGNMQLIVRMVDSWLETGKLPVPYVTPPHEFGMKNGRAIIGWSLVLVVVALTAALAVLRALVASSVLK